MPVIGNFVRFTVLVLFACISTYSNVASSDLFPIFTPADRSNVVGLLTPQTTFTPGNILVCRMGDGTSLTGNSAMPVFLDEYNSSGTRVQSISMPVAASGGNLMLTNSGTVTTECQITRSSDGRYILITGYNAPVGTVSVSTSGVARVIGRIDWAGLVNTSTSTTSLSNLIRSAASDNGTNLWAVGDLAGVVYTTLGSSGLATIVSNTVTNNRVINVYGDQLYTAASGSSVRLGKVGTGLPTTTAQPITNLPGFPTSGNFNGFYFADLSSSVAGLDTVYIANDSAAATPQTSTSGGVKKFSLVAGSWTYNGTFPASVSPSIPAAAFFGLTGSTSGTTVTLFATRNGTQLVSFFDTTGYNVTPTAIPTLVAVPDDTARMVFRGVSLTPDAPPPSLVIDMTGFTGNFGNVVVGTSSSSQSFVIAGSNLTSDITITPPSGFDIGLDPVGTFGSALTLPQSGGTVSNTTVYVRFHPTSPGAGGGNITSVSGTASRTVAVSGTGTIPGSLSFSSAAYSSAEDGGSITITVNRTGGTDGAVSAQISFADNSASGGSSCSGSTDFVNSPSTISFAAGDATAQTFGVPVCVDTTIEPDEVFFAALQNPTGGATIGSPNPVTMTIVDDDTASPFNESLTAPIDGATSIARNTEISVVFNRPADPATITANTSDTTCSGAIQVSTAANNFSSCIKFAGAPATSGGDTTFTLTPAALLAGNTTYLVRVTTAAQSADGISLSAQFTQSIGFTTRAAFEVVSTSPADGSRAAPNTQIAIQFGGSTDPATVTANTTDTSCAGSVQMSADNFVTCVRFAPGILVTGGNSIFALTPAAPLIEGTSYRIRATTDVKNDIGISLDFTYTAAGFLVLSPTAAEVPISGHIMTREGMGIRGAVVTITGSGLSRPISVVTGTFGYYHFSNVPCGGSYIVAVQSRRHTFAHASRAVVVNDSVSDVDFISEP